MGEVVRVGVLMRRMPERDRPGLWPAMIGTVLAHRILEVFPSIALIAWVLISAKIPAPARTALWGVAAAGITFVCVGIALARRHEQGGEDAKGRFGWMLARAREGLGILRRPIPSFISTGWQTIGWLLQLCVVYVTLLAFDIHLPLIAAAAVLAVANVALVLPLWPGNLGVLQAAIAVPLVAYGVPLPRAVAFGIALQAIESSVGYTAGIACLFREGLSVERLRAMGAREPDTHLSDADLRIRLHGVRVAFRGARARRASRSTAPTATRRTSRSSSPPSPFTARRRSRAAAAAAVAAAAPAAAATSSWPATARF